MRSLATTLTLLLLSFLPSAASANRQASSLTRSLSCTDLTKLQEPVITLTEDNSRGHYLGQVYSDGQVCINNRGSIQRLPLPSSSPELLVEGEPHFAINSKSIFTSSRR